MTTAKTPPTVVEALAAVMGDVQAIGKGDRNQQQGYAFRGVDSVVNAVGPALRAHGVVCVPISVTHDTEHYTTSKGTEMRDVTVVVGFRFYGPAGDHIDAMAAGEAADAGDKATPKAHSVAYRTMLLQALCIPTGDPDPDASTHERGSRPVRRQEGAQPVPTPKSWADIEAVVRACDNSEEAWALFQAFLRAAAYHLFGDTDQAKLTPDQRLVLVQKASGAAVWMRENRQPEGPFEFHDEAIQRKAWAHVLDGTALEIPDYEPPAVEQAEELDEEAARIAAEAFADPS